METARSMISQSKVPTEFWAEAANTATYVRNHSITTLLKGMTPSECLLNRKPDVSILQVFGCVAYAHSWKLEVKCQKCTLLGYPQGTKGFKLYDLSRKSFTRSRDFICNEKKFHNVTSEQSNEQKSNGYEFVKLLFRIMMRMMMMFKER